MDVPFGVFGLGTAFFFTTFLTAAIPDSIADELFNILSSAKGLNVHIPFLLTGAFFGFLAAADFFVAAVALLAAGALALGFASDLAKTSL